MRRHINERERHATCLADLRRFPEIACRGDQHS